MPHTTDFSKKPGAENRTVQDKLGKDLTRAMMTAPGLTLAASIASYQRMTGKTIHDPFNTACNCLACWQTKMEMQPVMYGGSTGGGL